MGLLILNHFKNPFEERIFKKDVGLRVSDYQNVFTVVIFFLYSLYIYFAHKIQKYRYFCCLLCYVLSLLIYFSFSFAHTLFCMF